MEYIHHGLIYKEFNLSFTLAEHLQVEQAQFENGLLHIDMVRKVPKVLQPQKITIGHSLVKEHSA